MDLGKLLEEKDAQQRLMDIQADESVQQADLIIKKHRKEINRLNDIATEAVLTNNFERYEYSVSKLKTIYKQPPMTKEQLRTLFETTLQSVQDLTKSLEK